MEPKGFENAKHIKYWAVGMEFSWLNARYRVLHTLEGGQTAVAVRVSHDSSDSIVRVFGRYEDRGTSILDLASVWEGREYERTTWAIPDARKCHVVAVSDTHIGILWGTDGSGLELHTRKKFAERFKPLLLNETAAPEPPVQVGECVEVHSAKHKTQGVVAYVSDDPRKHGFSVHDGYSENEFVWDDVKIVKLVPAAAGKEKQ